MHKNTQTQITVKEKTATVHTKIKITCSR